MVALEAVPEADRGGGDVDAVADEFGVEVRVVEDGTEDAGLALAERAHGVEGVGGGGGSGGDGGLGFGEGGVGVAEAYLHAGICGVLDQLESAGLRGFGGEGEELDVAAGGLLEAVEEGEAGRLEEMSWVDAAPGVREERAFEVDADGGGFAGRGGGFDASGDAVQGLLDGFYGRGDGGGEIVAGAVAGEETAYGAEAFGGRGHHVMAGGTVDVDVEERGGEDGDAADGGSVEMSAMRPRASMVMAG